MKAKMIYMVFLILLNTDRIYADSQTEAEEYKLKAAFVYNFTNFIDWGFSSAEEPFIIGIIGPSLIKGALEEIAKTKNVRNKKIIILEFNSPEEIVNCNILFISQKTTFPLEAILSKTVSKKTLTISENNGYALQGCCINFVLRNDKLKFETNLNAINSAGLKVSSQLLKLAIVVN
jgi:hypothetical protein